MALDKLIVSIKDLNDCHMQIRAKKKLSSVAGSILLGPLKHPVAWACCKARECSSAIWDDFLLRLGPSVCPEDGHRGPHLLRILGAQGL